METEENILKVSQLKTGRSDNAFKNTLQVEKMRRLRSAERMKTYCFVPFNSIKRARK